MDPRAGRGAAGERRRRDAPHAEREAAGLLLRLAGVLPQLRRQGWSGAGDEAAATEPAPDYRGRGSDGLAALAGAGTRQARLGPLLGDRVEADLLAVRH